VVAAAIHDVASGFDNHALKHESPHRPQKGDERKRYEASCRKQQSIYDGDRDEDRQRGRYEQPKLVAIGLEDTLDYGGDVEFLVHARHANGRGGQE
jgi:hypothetical protein